MQTKKILYIFLAVILFLCIFLGIFFLSKNIPEQDKSSQERFSQCRGETGSSYESCILNLKNCSSDECRYEQAVMSLDMEQCSNINSSNYRSQCVSHINHEEKFIGAVEQDDISLCEEFNTDKKITECKDNYYFVMAQNTGDKSLCNNISQEDIKNEC